MTNGESTFIDDEEDDGFIDISKISEDGINKKIGRRFFKHNWWLINPERWPKKNWDHLVALNIVR